MAPALQEREQQKSQLHVVSDRAVGTRMHAVLLCSHRRRMGWRKEREGSTAPVHRGLEEGEGKGMQLWCAEYRLSGTRGQCTGMQELMQGLQLPDAPPGTSSLAIFRVKTDLELSLSCALSTCV